jgi:transcriptional regulator with XRE-family HTH domain
MYQHFDKTLKEFGITGKKLAEVSGFSMTHISEFRHGKTNPSCEALERLLNGADQIKPGAKRYFCQLLAGETPQAMKTEIETMDSQQLARLLFTIAGRLESQNPVLAQELMSA